MSNKAFYTLLFFIIISFFFAGCGGGSDAYIYDEKPDIEIPSVSCDLMIPGLLYISGIAWQPSDTYFDNHFTLSLEKGEDDTYYLFIEEADAFVTWATPMIEMYEASILRASFAWGIEVNDGNGMETNKPRIFSDLSTITSRGLVLKEFEKSSWLFDDLQEFGMGWRSANGGPKTYSLRSVEEHKDSLCSWMRGMYMYSYGFMIVNLHAETEIQNDRIYFYEQFGESSAVTWSLPYDSYQDMISGDGSLNYADISVEYQTVLDPVQVASGLIPVVSYSVDPTDITTFEGVNQLVSHALRLNVSLYDGEVELYQWRGGASASAEVQSDDSSAYAEATSSSGGDGVFYISVPTP